MAYEVDFTNVSTIGLESSPVAGALAGMRANEARYFKNKYGHVFAVDPASKAQKTIDWVHRILKPRHRIGGVDESDLVPAYLIPPRRNEPPARRCPLVAQNVPDSARWAGTSENSLGGGRGRIFDRFHQVDVQGRVPFVVLVNLVRRVQIPPPRPSLRLVR
jgi:hypothetical protein